MHPACELCKGACCESMKINLSPLYPKLITFDTLRWIQAHGTVEEGGLRLETRCKHLIGGGCSIYSQRPQICRTYEFGGRYCREAVRDRRNNDSNILELLNDQEG